MHPGGWALPARPSLPSAHHPGNLQIQGVREGLILEDIKKCQAHIMEASAGKAWGDFIPRQVRSCHVTAI